MKLGRRLGPMLDLSRRGRGFGQFGGLTDQRVQLGIGWQIVDRGQLAELPHCVAARFRPAQLLAAPKIERRVLLERRHPDKDFPVDGEAGHAPFQRFLCVGSSGVYALSDALEDRLREGGRLGDISVEPRIAAQMMPPPSISRMIPTTITNRLRLRPVLLLDTAPTPAPTTASGMISQLAHPSKGMKAIAAHSRATTPMISETRLSMTSFPKTVAPP